MTTTNFTTTILVDQSPNEVFNAINNVRGWWSEEIEGKTEKLNDIFDYHYEDVHKTKIKLVEVIPNQKVVWLVLDNYFSFTKDKNEWKDNKIIFEISKKGNQTQLRFTQEGLVPEYECFDICQNAWTTYIQKSLFSLITTGKGQPNIKSKPKSDFSTIILVDQSAMEVFDAVNNVSGWWQGDIEGDTDKLNDEFDYRMEDVHFSKQKIEELVPGKKVVWLVTDSKLNFVKKKDEWTGTKIIFEISEINNKTQLRFTHEGLVPQFECFGDCANAWGELIQKSLFSLITTGKGVMVF